eukprot:GGOE01014804.1.p1 GENE.GGOE01014804.1~~GGOE01014804.1.p1  ORF type:complete len:1299 (-),score=455.54 GGOE01014804.1:132-4028(-)
MQNYQIYEEIGKGKVSTVYKGRKKRSIDYYAVKSIEKSQRAKVLNEVQILHALNHSNVLKFYNWYETNNHLWLILEFCSGTDLLAILKADKSLPESTIHGFCGDIADGLLYIHTRGVLYCDLKPSNVLVDGSGVVKLSDFGLAQHVDRLDYGASGGRRVGTPCYMAPELFQEGGVHSFASDLWSLGCVLYELAVGKPPFVAKDVERLMQMILFDAAEELDSFSEALCDLAKLLLQKDPLQRLTWQGMVEHPYWQGKAFELRGLPPQPAWERFAQEREEQAMLAKGPAEEKQAKVVTELSANAQSNARRAIASESYQQTGAMRGVEGATHVPLNPDTELDFGDHRADAEEEPPEDMPQKAKVPADLPPPPNGLPTALPDADDIPEPSDLNAHPSRLQDGKRVEDLQQLPRRPLTAEARHPTSPMLVPADQLLVHTTDTYVKPIMMNARIEKIAEPKFVLEDLPVPAHSLAAINAMPQKELEAFLTQVYRTIGGQTKVADKYNCLLYFQTLCCDTQAANTFINSSLMTLFIKMLQNANHPASLKAQLCMVMGLLVRHATFIHADLSTRGFVEACTALLQDTPPKDKKLRRRGAACLGELLFYIATQSSEDKAICQDVWRVSEGVIRVLVDCLRGDDEVTRHYLAKTIENIAAHPHSDCAVQFATTDVLYALIAVYLSPTKNEHLRTTAITALARLCRIRPSGLSTVVEELGPSGLLRQCAGNSARANQACINLLNMLLAQCIAHYAPLDRTAQPSFLYSQLTLFKLRPSTRDAESEEAKSSMFVACHLAVSDIQKIQADLRRDGGSFIPTSLVTILEQGSSALRGKCMLTVFLLAFSGLRFLQLCLESKLILLIDRLCKEKDAYLVSCLQSLLKVFGVVTTSSFSTLALDLECSNGSPLPPQTLENIAIGVHLLMASNLRALVTSNAIIEWLARSLAAVETLPPDAQTDVKRNLFAVVEAFSQDQSVLQVYYQAVVNGLLRALVGLLESSNGDTRFLCLKMFIDILMQFVSDADFYQAGSAEEPSRMLDDLIAVHVVPKFAKLLTDEDPIPLYGLKLMNVLTTENPALVVELYRSQLMPLMFSFFELENHNNNVHNVKLVLKFVECSAIPKKLVYEYGITAKLSSVLAYAYEKNVESFFEPCLDIAHRLLHATAQAAKESSTGEEYRMHHKQNAALSRYLNLFVLLSNHSSDVGVAELGAHCALLSAQLYSACHEPFLSAPTLANIKQALSRETDEMTIQQLLLKALLVVVSSAGSDRTRLEGPCRDDALRAVLARLAQCTDPDTRLLAGQINALLIQAM